MSVALKDWIRVSTAIAAARSRATVERVLVQWIDHKREPESPPDPNFPQGRDVDVSLGLGGVLKSEQCCKFPIPYPAKRCGLLVVSCLECDQTVALTTAGRSDDPRSVKMACKPELVPHRGSIPS